MAYYVVNGFPCENDYELITLDTALPGDFGIEKMKDRLGVSEEEHREIRTTLKRMECEFFDKLGELEF
ncbi:MAG: hypothetical protein H8D43_02910 [Chloroflexi bacterium]|nr:hypothetical protein [Chloroflexota bacterium]